MRRLKAPLQQPHNTAVNVSRCRPSKSYTSKCQLSIVFFLCWWLLSFHGLLDRVIVDWSYILARLRFKKLEKGQTILDYIAQHEQYKQIEEVSIAQILLVLAAHHPRLHPRSESNTQLPLRFTACKFTHMIPGYCILEAECRTLTLKRRWRSLYITLYLWRLFYWDRCLLVGF